MNIELSGALFVGVFVVMGALIVLLTLGISRLIAPRKLDPIKEPHKLSVYECGEPTIGNTDVKFNVNYYLFAIMFVIFDVEVAFFFPWAVAFKALGLYGVIAVALFLFLLIDGLIYAWMKGVLKWVY
ncbi:MAG: NADH-quinone oxidoreductase subunit A [Deinococcales bacterium]